jgi:DNA-binding protein H-NS
MGGVNFYDKTPPLITRTPKAMAKKTFLEIQKQIEQLQKEADHLRKQEADEVLARIKEAIAVYGFTAAELGVGAGAGVGRGRARKVTAVKPGRKQGGKSSASAPKYRDQNGNVWSGRGPRPAWFKAALEAGKSAEEFLAK